MEAQCEINLEIPEKQTVPKPLFCCIAATDYCMLRCRMCNKWKEPVPKPEEVPSLDDWKRFIMGLRELVDEGFEIDFGGGEALSLPILLDMVKFAKKNGFTAVLPTNGYILNEDMAKRIADSGLDRVSISLDTLNEKKYDYYRGVKGVYGRVMKAIDNLERYAPHVMKGICTIIMNENLDDLIPLVKWVSGDERLDWIYFMAVVQPNFSGALDAQWDKRYTYLWPQDSLKVLNTLDELISMKEKNSKISNRIEHLRAYKAYFANRKRFVNKAKCIIGGTALSINTYGFIQLCFFMDFIGNIRKDDIRELWYSDIAQKVRERVDSCKNNCHLLLNCCYIEDEPDLYRRVK